MLTSQRRLGDLPWGTLERIARMGYDQLLEKHEGRSWSLSGDAADLLRSSGTTPLAHIEGCDVLIPAHDDLPWMDVVRWYTSADGGEATLVVDDLWWVVRYPGEITVPRVWAGLCERVDEVYVVVLWHETADHFGANERRPVGEPTQEDRDRADLLRLRDNVLWSARPGANGDELRQRIAQAEGPALKEMLRRLQAGESLEGDGSGSRQLPARDER